MILRYKNRNISKRAVSTDNTLRGMQKLVVPAEFSKKGERLAL